MSRLPDNATALRFRNSIAAPAKRLSHYRVTCRDKAVHDVLAHDAEAARHYVAKRNPGAKIINVQLVAESVAADLRRVG
ncbi:hypothetical protein C8J36_103547 [Rhizobium sp. PP-F2F-G48]|uniref:hypothetical protein n=1 Tax=Rhizobium sp. PP-F2F-G48 TaxID=2135651 RepID=UPI0010533B4A|nr:hypothetical protein [Rhizobium sp. PP-F2F-G48]TCM56177.1 hypothetical protein C8J36_103547 [Rhizobium sp. PP-F2F-G48]